MRQGILRIGRPGWLLAMFWLAGCATAAPPQAAPASGVPPLTGIVLFPAQEAQPVVPRFRVAVTSMLDVAAAATVTLIDAVSNTSKGSTLSDTDGSFSLSMGGGFVPGLDPYYLEAVKGLSNNTVGKDAARVRTMVKFSAGTWQSLTGADLVVSKATTAVSALANLKGLSAAQQDSLFGKVGTDNPATFDSSGGAISAAEYATTADLVKKALDGDRDPLDSLLWNSTTNTVYLRPGVGAQPPVIFGVFPNPAAVGEKVFVTGASFGDSPGTNAVDFGGVQAESISVFADRLEVVVPPGARSGNLTVATPDGASGVGFLVLPGMGGTFLGV